MTAFRGPVLRFLKTVGTHHRSKCLTRSIAYSSVSCNPCELDVRRSNVALPYGSTCPAVAEMKHFGEAATTLHVTRSAVSQRIKALEKANMKRSPHSWNAISLAARVGLLQRGRFR
ncbi:LysR family transcriptional regulator [Burkholderia cenocepacia]